MVVKPNHTVWKLKYLAAVLLCLSLSAHGAKQVIPGSICATALPSITVTTPDRDRISVYELVASQYGLSNGDHIANEKTYWRVLLSQTLLGADVIKCIIDSLEMESA